MGLIIQRFNGITYNTDDYGLRLLDFAPESPNYNTVYETIEGQDGAVDTITTVDVRKISAKFDFIAEDAMDFPLLRNAIYQLFHSKEAFYLIDEQEPGKRWRVKVDPYTVERLRYIAGHVELSFIAAAAYAESIGTTQGDFTFDSGLWQIGQGLLLDDDSKQYTFTTPSFSLYNAGDVPINPSKAALVITFTGASTALQIQNVTTGDTWKYSGNTVAGDTITLTGVKSLKNGVSIFKDTNYKVITIATGWNEFVITGASGAFSISFDFRYLYL